MRKTIVGSDYLHAHWRMPYIEAQKPDIGADNPFVRLPAMNDDRAALIIWRGPSTFLILNKFPYNAGHLLAVPYRAVPALADLTPAERADLMETIVKAQEILTKAMKPAGFNIGLNFGRAAGAGIPEHLHAHIVPRWVGDNNFMPVVADTKVLPVALETLWLRLRDCVG